MRVLFTTLIILVIIATFFIWSGMYNIAAVKPHSTAVRWLFSTVRDRSIGSHSQEIKPPSLTDAALVQAGFDEYHAMCFTCHGAPGHDLSEIGKGLNPSPPKLDAEEIQNQYSDAELYWIVKNGIRMTGMPAFGPTHEEKELWSIVAFVRHLRGMKAQEYNALVETAGSHEGAEHGHTHAHEHGPAAEAEEEMHHAHEHEQGLGKEEEETPQTPEQGSDEESEEGEEGEGD